MEESAILNSDLSDDQLNTLSHSSGQALLEYVLLLAIVLFSVRFFFGQFDQRLKAGNLKHGARLESQLRTGSGPPEDIWIK